MFVQYLKLPHSQALLCIHMYNVVCDGLHMYTLKNLVMVGPDKPEIPVQRCFKLVSSHQQGMYFMGFKGQ